LPPLVTGLATFKPPRTTLVLGAVVAYGWLCAFMAGPSFTAAGSSLYLLLTAWIIGLAVLLMLDDSSGRFGKGGLTVSKALWLNVGVVASSLYVPSNARVLLLTVPLFGILYAALYVSRGKLALVTVVTWCSYLLGALAVLPDPEYAAMTEGRLALAFTLMLLAMFFMASEVTALRNAFERRRRRLDAAMQKLADLAMRDDLTGLCNRRYVMEVLARQKALADRGNVGFTLCYCDLDHFKRINDRFGHQRGDDVLREFAVLTEQVVRSVDFVARFGGEEFLLVLIGADAVEAGRVVARLSERTRRLQVDPNHPDYRLSVSVGIAEFRPGERIEDVIQRADHALYRAKSAGRDLVVTA
jgi:diguanylate cyclase